jgi:hypothetical protein
MNPLENQSSPPRPPGAAQGRLLGRCGKIYGGVRISLPPPEPLGRPHGRAAVHEQMLSILPSKATCLLIDTGRLRARRRFGYSREQIARLCEQSGRNF